ncbi:MAG TPA: DUF542 domain-containing protein [Bryobacteraceae bacterium]|jgi:regulator of cell morphogenesis and NO signaling|nr:DUF542 domain-containing protein [Bryobacteraceae bacterium]
MSGIAELTLGEIAIECPGAAPVFEKYRMDYGCGGRRRFLDACLQAGLDPAGIEAEIAASESSPVESKPWKAVSLQALIRHLVEVDHPCLRKGLIDLDRALMKSAVAASLQRALSRLTRELNLHLDREDAMVFPVIVRLEAAREANAVFPRPVFGSVRHPIWMMEQEHRKAAAILDEALVLARQDTPGDADRDALRSFRESLEAFEIRIYRNFHLENNILYPRAARLEQEATA